MRSGPRSLPTERGGWKDPDTLPRVGIWGSLGVPARPELDEMGLETLGDEPPSGGIDRALDIDANKNWELSMNEVQNQRWAQFQWEGGE